MVLKLLFVVVLVILKVDLAVKAGTDVVDGNNCDKFAGSKTMRGELIPTAAALYLLQKIGEILT